ncbi:MAG TPA: FISUMP domain-containing protein [bacterium]|nr:FISUMP domain-containing protein [bacterium]HPT29726.1 FISUMP domain-containing protein [bacterium]
MTKKTGFSLVEMLVALFIIGLISAIVSVSVSSFRQKSRDTERMSDIKQIQAALELYRQSEGSYPDSLTFGAALMGSTSSTTVYAAKLPTNPITTNHDNCSGSEYAYSLNSKGSYNLEFCLERGEGEMTIGSHCARPTGINNSACFVCGDSLTYGGEAYPTVLIGTQCWFAKNLNIGTMITGASNPANNGIIEKYCYNNSEASCTTYGGLYQWNEAMQYLTTEAVQGICPTGWHIPTDAEQHILNDYLKDSGQTCSASRLDWDCSTAGTKLKTGGTSGFEGLLAGYHDPNGSFVNGGWYGHFWSSTISGLNALYQALGSSQATVFRYVINQPYGFSIRCLKN